MVDDINELDDEEFYKEALKRLEKAVGEDK